MAYLSTSKSAGTSRTVSRDTREPEAEQAPVNAAPAPVTDAAPHSSDARTAGSAPDTQGPQRGQPGPNLARVGTAVIDAAEPLPYLVRAMIFTVEKYSQQLGLQRHVEAQVRELRGQLDAVEQLSADVVADARFLLGFASDDTSPLEGARDSLATWYGRIQATAQEYAAQILVEGHREAADRFVELATTAGGHAGKLPSTGPTPESPQTGEPEATDKAALVGRSRGERLVDQALDQFATPERYPQFTNAMLQGLRVLGIGFVAGTLGAVISPLLAMTAGAITVLRGIVRAVRSEKRERELGRLKVHLTDEELRTLATQGEEQAKQEGDASAALMASGVGAMVAGLLAFVGATVPPVAIVAMLLGAIGMAWMARRWLKARKKKRERMEEAGAEVVDTYFDGNGEDRREARKLLAEANRKALERLERQRVTVVDNPLQQARQRSAEQAGEAGAAEQAATTGVQDEGGRREVGRRTDNAELRKAMHKALDAKVGRTLRDRAKDQLAVLAQQLLGHLLDPNPRTSVETDALLRGFGLDTAELRKQTTSGEKQQKKARQKVYYTIKKAVM